MAALYLQRLMLRNGQFVASRAQQCWPSAVNTKARLNHITSQSFHSSPQSYSKILYTETHEWIRIDEKVATIGITDFAQEQLGDIAFCDLPTTGSTFEKGECFATIESVKAASDLYMPVNAKVVKTNDSLVDSPSIINESPFDKGWLVKVELTDDAKPDLDLLLDGSGYEKLKSSAEDH